MNLECGSISRTSPLIGGVIIADDDPSCRLLLERAFHGRGQTLQTFDNGNDAWHAIQDAQRLTLVVVNWMLPGLDGYRICQSLAQRNSSHLTVLMVGRHFLEQARPALQLCAMHILAKPLDGCEVLQIQEALAEGRSDQTSPEMASLVMREGQPGEMARWRSSELEEDESS